MKFISKLPDVEELQQKYFLSNYNKQKRDLIIDDIKKILSGKSNKKLLIVGPCSADKEKSVVEYVVRLSKLSERVRDIFLTIPRIYTSKPRTNGLGYKGMLHSPSLKKDSENIMEGIKATRKIHLAVIKESGLFGADEMLYPESIYYIVDLLTYAAIGARSVEDQYHRMMASGIRIPVGMKNPTSGSIDVMLNSISAAQHSHVMMYRGWEVETEGNIYAHGILRGYSDKECNNHPNYHYEDMCNCYDKYLKSGLANCGIIVDCNHGNSNKNYEQQIRIANEVVSYCKDDKNLKNFIKGFMIESYLEDGNQLVGGGVYGKSITDACLGWDKTENLILELADKLA